MFVTLVVISSISYYSLDKSFHEQIHQSAHVLSAQDLHELRHEEKEILEDSYEASIDAGVAETIKDLPDPIKELIKFVNKGGDYTQMLSSLAKQSVTGISKDTDMEVESNQIKVITQERQLQGYDAEEISGEIEYLKEAGKLKTTADKLFPKTIERQEKEITTKAAAQAAYKAEAKEKQRLYKSEITTQVGSLNDIKGKKLFYWLN